MLEGNSEINIYFAWQGTLSGDSLWNISVSDINAISLNISNRLLFRYAEAWNRVKQELNKLLLLIILMGLLSKFKT